MSTQSDRDALAQRLRVHARIHREHEPFDEEARQWANDLETAATLLESGESSSEPMKQPSMPYSLDHDPAGIRALAADAILGAMAYGAQGTNRPPEGHWLMPFWELVKTEREEARKAAPSS